MMVLTVGRVEGTWNAKCIFKDDDCELACVLGAPYFCSSACAHLPQSRGEEMFGRGGPTIPQQRTPDGRTGMQVAACLQQEYWEQSEQL